MKPIKDQKGNTILGGWLYKRIELNTVKDFEKVEKMVEEGWEILRSTPWSIELQKQNS